MPRQIRRRWWWWQCRWSKNRNENDQIVLLTLFLHVTWTMYLVSGHRLSSIFAESVNRLPIKPPPKTSHVTRQLMSWSVGSQAKCVATRNSCLIIDAIRNCHWFWAIACWCDDIVLHVSQHCNENQKIRIDGDKYRGNEPKSEKKKTNMWI